MLDLLRGRLFSPGLLQLGLGGVKLLLKGFHFSRIIHLLPSARQFLLQLLDPLIEQFDPLLLLLVHRAVPVSSCLVGALARGPADQEKAARSGALTVTLDAGRSSVWREG